MTAAAPEPGAQYGGLEPVLAGWLVAQRWFGGKGRPVSRLVVETLTELPAEEVRLLHTVVQVRYSDGQVERYQVPLSLRPGEVADLAHALVGLLEDGPRSALYDAVHDPPASRGLLDLMARAAGGTGRARTGPLEAVAAGPVQPDGSGRPVGTEQSNTSVVYGSSLILKLFRRLAPGENPDLGVTRALAGVGCPAVIPPYGWVTGPVAGTATTLMLLQPYLTNATEGWKLATTSVRDLYAEQDLHADEVGGDFAAESERLGAATADVHASMAAALPTGRADEAAVAAMVGGMQVRLTRAAAQVPELRPFTTAAAAAFDAAGAERGPEGLAVQRIHGDFHLGQVLRGPDRWLLVDFEGEPAVPLAARTALASPLRDVAGMLRSFDYAARSLLGDHPGGSYLAYRATEWADRNVAAFCEGYASVTGSDPRGDAVLLRAFELDKAVYEVVYEARNRPTWLTIPLGAVERLLG